MELNECKKKGIIRKTKINQNLAKSLIEMSNIKEQSLNQVSLDEITINAFLPIAYDSLREVLEALCVLHGFKVLNHDCLGKLVKDLDSSFDLISFERLRYMRNGINYYGNKVSFDQGKIMIKDIFLFKNHIIKKINSIENF